MKIECKLVICILILFMLSGCFSETTTKEDMESNMFDWEIKENNENFDFEFVPDK